jgi:Pyridoxamine 5'-phosphate oxidase
MHGVHETDADITWLQELLDRSYDAAGEHLRSITTPPRRIGADELGALLGGVQVLNLATVTPSGAPRVSPVDGLFYRAHFYFSSSTTSQRWRNLQAHPQISAAHTRGEELAVVVHGTAQLFGLDDPDRADFRAYAEEVYIPLYGDAWREFVKSDTIFCARIEPERMFTFRMDQPSLNDDKA